MPIPFCFYHFWFAPNPYPLFRSQEHNDTDLEIKRLYECIYVFNRLRDIPEYKIKLN